MSNRFDKTNLEQMNISSQIIKRMNDFFSNEMKQEKLFLTAIDDLREEPGMQEIDKIVDESPKYDTFYAILKTVRDANQKYGGKYYAGPHKRITGYMTVVEHAYREIYGKKPVTIYEDAPDEHPAPDEQDPFQEVIDELAGQLSIRDLDPQEDLMEKEAEEARNEMKEQDEGTHDNAVTVAFRIVDVAVQAFNALLKIIDKGEKNDGRAPLEE